MSGPTRRRVLQALAAIGSAPLAHLARAAAPQRLPWLNWSGGQRCQPAGRVVPGSEDELAHWLARTDGPIRPVGSGHSFAPLVPTDGHIVVLDQLTGLVDHDADQLRATFAAGTRLGDMGPALHAIGQAMPNLPDIDRQTLAGATATGTHGTGVQFGCLSDYVTGLRLITPRGEVLDVDARTQPELLAAASVSLGALGIVTRMTLQNRTPFRLKSTSRLMHIDEALDNFDALAARHRHFELFPFLHSDYTIALSTDADVDPDEPTHNPAPTPAEDAALAQAAAVWAATPRALRRGVVNTMLEAAIDTTTAVDHSWRILANIRNTRFNEMEYSVPAAAGARCLREVLAAVSDNDVPVYFPLEYRYVAAGASWLGMNSGDEPHATISVHQSAGEDWRPYFDLVEPIFWKYGGRPHWGKLHSLDARALRALYPRFGDFQALRAELDPGGRMLNDHLRPVLVD